MPLKQRIACGSIPVPGTLKELLRFIGFWPHNFIILSWGGPQQATRLEFRENPTDINP